MNEWILSVAMAVAGTGLAFDVSVAPRTSAPLTGSPASSGNAPAAAGFFPEHWKSAVTGAVWTIRKDHDGLYLERLLSHAALRDQHLTRLELHRGKKGYRGAERQVVGGAYTDPSGREVSYRCIFDWPAELAVLTESRVEIRVLSPPDNARIDFSKCAVEKTRVWHTAVWTPE